ncbi:MAG: AAA family ATPase [Planctomycetaceae bacterium]
MSELQAREWLATVIGDVKSHINDLQTIHKLGNCLKQTRPVKITNKSKELAKTHVSDQLRDAFATEIRKLEQGVRRLNVELSADSGGNGSVFFRVQLVRASKAEIGAVVSEGEHRCIALAGFLSELCTESSSSAIVFDDPVTSLDHQWRGCFARRLVEESKNRQVIVFTHDIVFLHDLLSDAEQLDATIALRRVQSTRDHSGVVSEGLPWIAQKTLPRINELQNRARATRKDYDAQNDDVYDRAICSVYSDLRATIERAVEEHVFQGVVTRHQDYINLGKLRKTTVLTTSHCERLQKLFKRCCDITSAHDRAALRSFGVPKPDEALADIDELKTLVDEIKDLQKQIA